MYQHFKYINLKIYGLQYLKIAEYYFRAMYWYLLVLSWKLFYFCQISNQFLANIAYLYILRPEIRGTILLTIVRTEPLLMQLHLILTFCSFIKLLAQMALPNAAAQMTQLNPGLALGGNTPGTMGAIVAAMATQQQQQAQGLQPQLTQTPHQQAQVHQGSSSLFSSPGSAGQALPPSSYSSAQTVGNSNAANGALGMSPLPNNMSGTLNIEFIFMKSDLLVKSFSSNQVNKVFSDSK